MGRSPCCEKVGLKKGPWTPEEDQKLVAYIEQHGHGSWRALPAKAGLRRCGKSCRLRWTNYLRPDIKRGKFSLQEEQTIIQLHALLGNRWSAIAAHLPKRTDNEIKNYWNTHLKKRLARMGIDPTTHRPKADAFGYGGGQFKDVANLSHMAQWESARLEAEARLVRESKFQAQNQLGSSSTSPQPARLVISKIPAQPSLPPCLDVIKAWQSSWTKSPLSTKENSRMFNMYAMKLAAADDLESPTSTLSFPAGRMLPSLTTIGQFNDNFLPPTAASAAGTASVTCEDCGMIGEAGENGINNTRPCLGDHDDIMVAVEAFRSGGYDQNVLSNNAMEGMNNDDMLIYDSIENLVEGNLGIVNGVNFEDENNKDYWNNILMNMANDLPSGSPVF